MSASFRRFRARTTAVALGTVAVRLFLGGPAAAQPAGRLEGTISIAGRGDGFPGARVVIPSLGTEAVTDLDGRFAFAGLPPGEHEVLTEIIGCQPARWTVEVFEGRAVTLTLVVDGPAFARRVGDGSGGPAAAVERNAEPPYTVERLGPEDLRHDPARTIADMLRGTFPGVKVVQGSGLPGERISLQFRGPTSISGSRDPLVVVDGMITGGGLDDIDPRDVESVAILKGSVGAAMYGARGHAGVIEITTASGRSGRAACYFRSSPSM